jgi:hypothetical protein
MTSGYVGKSGRADVSYDIVVRGGVTERFLEPLGCVVVESDGDETTLRVEVVDQAKLRSILNWLYDHGVDLVSVSPASGSPPT